LADRIDELSTLLDMMTAQQIEPVPSAAVP